MKGDERTLGPLLFQLPPNWYADAERLRSFLQVLPDGQRYVLEFRDPSWFGEQITDLLREHGVAFCIHDMRNQPSPKVVTAEFIYIRKFENRIDAGRKLAQKLADYKQDSMGRKFLATMILILVTLALILLYTLVVR